VPLADASLTARIRHLGWVPQRNLLGCVQQLLAARDVGKLSAQVVLGEHEVRLALAMQRFRRARQRR
jgi:hypothetical protein